MGYMNKDDSNSNQNSMGYINKDEVTSCNWQKWQCNRSFMGYVNKDDR